MQGIYIAAAITTVVAVAWYGAVALKIGKIERAGLITAFFLALPLSPLVFYVVRLPLDSWVAPIIGRTSSLYPWVALLYAPLTEEPAKLLPLLLPFLRRRVSAQNFVAYALALGLGFGVGELWFLAYQTARVPAFASLPFYAFSGFFLERLIVCLLHGAFVAVSLWGLTRRSVWGVLGAMALHLFANLPIILAAQKVGGLDQAVWQQIIWVWLFVYFGLLAALLARLQEGAGSKPLALFGQARCPECKKIYAQPLFGINWIYKRYERCPHCGKFHWIGREETSRSALASDASSETGGQIQN